MSEPAPDPVTADRRRALRVGILALLSLVILVAILVVTGPLKIVRGSAINIDFAFVGPIKPGASVRVSGVIVGAIESVDLLAGQDAAAGPDKMVRVRAKIEQRAMPVVTDTARYRVTTLGVLGEHYLDIEPVPGGRPLADNARVDGVTGARPDLLLARAAGLLERTDDLLASTPAAIELMKSTASLMKRLDELLAKDAASDDVKQLTAELRTVIHGAAVAVGDGKNIKASVDALPKLLESTGKLEGDLDQAGVGALIVESRAVVSRLEHTLDLLEKQPLADPAKQEQLRDQLASTLRSVDAFAKRGDRLLGAVEDKKGAAGKLFWDEEAAGDLKGLLHGLRSDPVKFLLSPPK